MAIKIEAKTIVDGYIESLIGGRSENQDFAFSADAPLGTIVVLCDGMGGMNGGSVASQLAVKTIIDDVIAAAPDDSPSVVLSDAVKHANRLIIETAMSNQELVGMGTTVVAVIVSPKSIIATYVGDSRIYQLRGRKKVFRTFDHSVVFQMVQAKVLTEEQARSSSMSNVITKALGITNELEPEIFELPYVKGDRFLLCSDGFWGAMPEPSFLKMVTAKGDLKSILLNSTSTIDCLGIAAGGGHDNLTAALFRVNSNSKLEPKMTLKTKIIIGVLSLLLLVSISFNCISLFSEQGNNEENSSSHPKGVIVDTTQQVREDSTK